MTADPLLYVNGPNMYQFVGDNPINRTDWTGLITWAPDINGSFSIIPLDRTDIPRYEKKLNPDVYKGSIAAGGEGYEAIYKPNAAHSNMGMSIHVGQVIQGAGKKAHWDVQDNWASPDHKRGLPAYSVNPNGSKMDNDHAGGALGFSGMYSFFDSPGGTEKDNAFTFDIELVAYTSCGNKVLGAALFHYKNATRTTNADFTMPPPWGPLAGGKYTIVAQAPSPLATGVLNAW